MSSPAQPEQRPLPLGGTIQQRFEAFDQRHPEVYQYLEQQCFELRARGWKHFGIKCLYERTRFYFSVEQDMRENYKLNNNYPSRYVRLLIENHPELEGFFELREIRAA